MYIVAIVTIFLSKNNSISYACPECRGTVQPSQVIMTTMDKIKQDRRRKRGRG